MKAVLWSGVLIACLLSATSAALAAGADERDPLTVSASSEPSSWSPGQSGQLTFKIALPASFHAYEDKFSLDILEPDGFVHGALKISPIHEFDDKFSKKKRMGFTGEGTITVPIEAPSHWVKPGSDLVVQLSYQACSESFCLFPVHRAIHIPVTLVGSESPASNTPMPTHSWISSERLQLLLGESKLLALFFVFLAGILTSFTPCIFPMIPITLAVIGHHSETRTRLQNFILTVFYVGGLATTYSSMGVLAASSGAVFGASLGNPWLLSVICLLFLIMSLSMYGLFEIQVPAFMRNTLGVKKTSPGYVGAYFSGMIAGLVASPCVGPILVVILAWVATTGSKIYGFALLFSYAVGMGMIFLLLGAFTELTRKLPRSGKWLNGTKFFLGSLMLGAFYYYLSLLVPIRWFDGALGVGLITLGSIAGAFLPFKGTAVWSKIRKGFAQTTFYIGIAYLALGILGLRPLLDPMLTQTEMMKSSIAWEDYSEAALAQAKASGQPVIIDFWADWCAACHELDGKTFTDSKVSAELKKFKTLKFNATEDSLELRAMKAKWKIQGLPTVIFIDKAGQWKHSLTLTEFENSEKFLERLKNSE